MKPNVGKAVAAILVSGLILAPQAKALDVEVLKDPIFKKVPIGVQVILSNEEANDIAKAMPAIGANFGPPGVAAFGAAGLVLKAKNKGNGVIVHYTNAGPVKAITGVHTR